MAVDANGDGTCWWATGTPELHAYHDTEWGRPVSDDIRLFEKLCLEGFQAGLSWLTILRKREAFRAAFVGFDFEKVAHFDDADIDRILSDKGVVRHRGKIEAAISNARRAIELRAEYGSLAAFFWSFEPTDGARPSRIDREALQAMAVTPESTRMSKELKRRGWRFVGPTTMYALMQAMGLVNDHEHDCSCRAAVEAERNAFDRPRSDQAGVPTA